MSAVHINGMAVFRGTIKLVWLLMLSACLAPIDFSTENIGGTVVIAGQVSNITDQNFIQIGLTADKERLPYPFSGADVRIVDEETNDAFGYYEDQLRIGTYIPFSNFTPIPGRTYHIVVEMNGKVYESLSEKMPATVPPITTQYEFETKEFTDLEGYITLQTFINIKANAGASGSDATYLRWAIEEAFLLSPTDFPDPFGSVPPPCFVVQNADPQRIVLLSTDDIGGNPIQNLMVGSRIVDWTFLERHYFTTYQSAMTKEAYEYWRKVNILSNQVGSIFDTPPAKLTGNISNVADREEDVYGYFQATNQTFTRFYLIEQDLPFKPTNTTCGFDNRDYSQYPTRCLECTTVPNSSYNRPDWF